MKEKDDGFNLDLGGDLELIKKNQKNNIDILKKNLGYVAPGADNNYLNLNINNIIKEKNNNNNLGIIQKPLNILVFDGTDSTFSNGVSDAILGNGVDSKAEFPKNKFFCCDVVGGNGAKVTRVLCDQDTFADDYNNKEFCSNSVNGYDVIVLVGLNQSSDRYVLDFIANKIKEGNDDNLIVYGDNYLSNEVNMNWFKYHLPYVCYNENLLKKIASFDKSTGKFVEWDGKDKDDPNYEQSKIDGLKGTGTVGEIVPKGSGIIKHSRNPRASKIFKDSGIIKHSRNPRASKIFKDHCGKIAAGVVLLEEIFLGKIRENLLKIFKSKETEKNKENKEHKAVDENQSANNDVGKEKTL